MVICAVIFVTEEIEEAIGEAYNKYNPISSYVKPHLTLLFPLETELRLADICAHLEAAASEMDRFVVRFNGVKLQPEELLIYMEVSDGANQLRRLNRRLYSGHFEKFLQVGRAFYPHLTLGRFESEAKMKGAYQELESFNPDLEFTVEKLELLQRKAPHQWETIRTFDFGKRNSDQDASE